MFSTEGKEEAKHKVDNVNVAETIKKWFLGGTSALSDRTISCLADTLSAKLA